MASPRIWKLLLQRVLREPMVSVPLVLGASALAAAHMMGDSASFFELLGASGVLFGLGMGLTRIVWATSEVVDGAADDLRNELEREQLNALDRLESRLRKESDPRPRQTLVTMRLLCQRLHSPETWSGTAGAELLPEIKEHTVQLYQSCVASLERTSVLWEASQKMLTREGRQRVLAAREELIAEVQRGIDQLGHTLDQLYATAIERDRSGAELAAIRGELDAGLEVSRRIEQRLSQFEQTLQNPDNTTKD